MAADMGMLAFFPWLRVRDQAHVGAFRLHPHCPGSALPQGVSAQVSANDLKCILTPYRALAHQPLRSLVLVQYDDLPVGAELDETARGALFRFARNLAVSGLAMRRFDGNQWGTYSANGHYQLIIQAYPEPFSGSVSVTHRRKDGATTMLIGTSEHFSLMPEYLVHQVQLDVDTKLLVALEGIQALPDEAQAAIEASLTQFLLANSDAPEMPFDPESVATCAAFERLVSAGQGRADLQGKLLALLTIAESAPSAAELRSTLGALGDPKRPVFRDWLRHVHALRGNAGHGHRVGKFSLRRWDQRELLMSAALLYPLALKCLLQRDGLYTLTEEDVAFLVGFDVLLEGTPFFGRPRDLQSSDSAKSGWVKTMEEIGMTIAMYQLSRTIHQVVDEKRRNDPPPAPE